MNAYTKIHAAPVNGPSGVPLTVETLPPPGTTHWVMRRKAEVLAAIKGGLLSIEGACELYDLSLDEIMMWERTVKRSGIYALRVTKIQNYKSVYSRQVER